jgi:hypothetical protein
MFGRWPALLLVLTLGAVVRAQPAMPDPAMMSGIPRPDPNVPAGTITVRLIRGGFQNPLTGVEAELGTLGQAGQRRTARTDAAGRATFAGLPRGTYEARAVVDGEARASQPIELPESPGVAVLLVFDKSVAEQQKELGTPDGKARVSLELPPGELVVRVVDEGTKPLQGLQVSLHHADRDTEKVETLKEQKTDEQGTVRFAGLATGPGDGYLASVVREGARMISQPLRLIKSHGSLVVLMARKASPETDKLRIGESSHVLMEMQDDAIQVMEILQLENPLQQAVVAGEGGVRIPLPEGALSPQVVPGEGGQAPPVTIDMSQGAPEAVWQGPVPPGASEIRIGLLLRHGGSLRFRQRVSVPWASVRVVIEKTPELGAEAPGYEPRERPFMGRSLLLLDGPAQSSGGVIEFSLSGLPYSTPLFRYLAALVALAIAVAFAVLALRAPRTDTRAAREKLEQRRRDLMEQILRLEDEAQKKGASKGKTREQLVAELEQVYRELDALEGR